MNLSIQPVTRLEYARFQTISGSQCGIKMEFNSRACIHEYSLEMVRGISTCFGETTNNSKADHLVEDTTVSTIVF
jgi:hypothetical protein